MKLKLKLGIFLLLALSAVVFNACKKESKDEVTPTTNPGNEPTVTKPDGGNEEVKEKAFKVKVNVKAGNVIKVFTNKNKFNYDYEVDWGDGSEVQKNIAGNVSHKFAKEGEFIVSFKGKYPWIYFSNSYSYPNRTITSVEQWGNSEWEAMAYMFHNCKALKTINATDVPNLSKVKDINSMFKYASLFNGNIGDWDVSNIKHMETMFFEAASFNQSLENWKVGNVTGMASMFNGALDFNQPLNKWNVSSVKNMENMFLNARSFNQPLNDWKVDSVSNMQSMFKGLPAFNQPLNKWNVSSVTNMENMFAGASSFNQSLKNWNVSKVTNYDYFARYSNLDCNNIPSAFSTAISGCK